MKTILPLIASLMTSASYAGQIMTCGLGVCGSYAGTVYVKDTRGNPVDQYQEVLNITAVDSNNTAYDFKLTQSDGTTSKYSYNAQSSGDGSYTIQVQGQNFGTASCNGMVCSSTIGSGDNTEMAELDFSVSGQITANYTETDNGTTYYKSTVLTQQ